jgi:hypothetical protein
MQYQKLVFVCKSASIFRIEIKREDRGNRGVTENLSYQTAYLESQKPEMTSRIPSNLSSYSSSESTRIDSSNSTASD